MKLEIELPDDWRPLGVDNVRAPYIAAVRAWEARESDGTLPAGPLSVEGAVRCWAAYSGCDPNAPYAEAWPAADIATLAADINAVRGAATLEEALQIARDRLHVADFNETEEEDEADARAIRRWLAKEGE